MIGEHADALWLVYYDVAVNQNSVSLRQMFGI